MLLRDGDRWASAFVHELFFSWMIWTLRGKCVTSHVSFMHTLTLCWHFSHSAPFADRYTYRPLYCPRCQTHRACFIYSRLLWNKRCRRITNSYLHPSDMWRSDVWLCEGEQMGCSASLNSDTYLKNNSVTEKSQWNGHLQLFLLIISDIFLFWL